MAGILDPSSPAVPPPSPDPDDDIFSELFDLGVTEGAVPVSWERATACQCLTPDTKQPVWGCPHCGGDGVTYSTAEQITGLFRGRTQFQSFRREGELAHGEAQLTTPLSVKPVYVDRLVRDRLTILAAAGDQQEGTVFFPATPAIPFIFDGLQRAWRVQLQSARRSQELAP